MPFNELAQWAAIAFLGIFVLGLTRQLGNFLVPAREQIAYENGPPVGRGLSADLLDGHRERILALMDERNSQWAMLLIVSNDCSACEPMLARVKEYGLRRHMPVVALSRKSDHEHEAALHQLADVVIVDAKKLERAKLRVTPFVIVLDKSMTVMHKELASDLSQLMSDLGIEAQEHANGRQNTNADLLVRTVGRGTHGATIGPEGELS